MKLFKQLLRRRELLVPILMAATALLITPVAGAQTGGKDGGPAKAPSAISELPPGSPELMRPEELAKALQSSAKPIVLNVGPRVIYLQAHIPGAEYIGSTAKPEGLEETASTRGLVAAPFVPGNLLRLLSVGTLPQHPAGL